LAPHSNAALLTAGAIAVADIDLKRVAQIHTFHGRVTGRLSDTA
jgi:hypothetical protein